MKKLKYTLIALALGICSASAIFLDVHHDTQKKLDFTIDWHIALPVIEPNPYQGFSVITLYPFPYLSDDPNFEDFIDFAVYIESPLFHDPPLTFTRRAQWLLVYHPYPDNLIRIDFPTSIWKLGNDLMSARFTFHEKDYLPAPIQVPEGGPTLLLMGIAMITVIGIRSYRLEKA